MHDELELGCLDMRAPAVGVTREETNRCRDVLVDDFGIDGESGSEELGGIIDEIRS
jgi:hypothetical protein